MLLGSVFVHSGMSGFGEGLSIRYVDSWSPSNHIGDLVTRKKLTGQSALWVTMIFGWREIV